MSIYLNANMHLITLAVGHVEDYTNVICTCICMHLSCYHNTILSHAFLSTISEFVTELNCIGIKK